MFTGSELWTLASGVTLVLLALIFTLLERLGDDNFYHKANRAISRGLAFVWFKITHLRYRIGLNTIRLTVHYLLHKCLVKCGRLLSKMTKYVRGLEKSNREKAKSVKKAKSEQSHLNQIAAHKKVVSLTEEQKLELKERKLIAE